MRCVIFLLRMASAFSFQANENASSQSFSRVYKVNSVPPRSRIQEFKVQVSSFKFQVLGFQVSGSTDNGHSHRHCHSQSHRQ